MNTMRTNHQLARLKAHSLGNIAIFGDSYENGIFSKINTFGGVPKAIKARRIYDRRSSALNTSLIARGDNLDDNFFAPRPGMSPQAAQQTAARSYAIPARADLFDADYMEADSTLVGKPLLTYQEWDAGNPAPRSESEATGRQNAYDAYKSAWQSSNAGSSNLGSGPAHMAYFGDDREMNRKEGGIMTSITTFGNAEGEEEEHPSHLPQYLAGSGGTALMLAIGYFALKWTRRI